MDIDGNTTHVDLHEPTPSKDSLHDSSTPYSFVLLSEGQTLTFEIGICEPPNSYGLFNEHHPSSSQFLASRLTHEDLMKWPEKLEDRHLFVRFRDSIFGWEKGSPALATLALYRKVLVDAQQAKLPPQGHPSRPAAWKRWWGGRSRTATEESVQSAVSSSASQNKLKDNMKEENAIHSQRAVSEPPLSPSPPSSPSMIPTNPVLSQAGTLVAHALTDSQPSATSPSPEKSRTYAKTLRLTSDQLKGLNLQKGKNTLTYTVQSSFSGVAVITARIFLWEQDYQVVISDIDGTITK